jgi:thiosulfate reductase cytochrome b subunit
MAKSAELDGLVVPAVELPAKPRHSALVRITHWITAANFIALVVSGVAILLAHPRLYWGETGAVGTPSLIDLPLPFMLDGQSGWGRYLHFLAAWIGVLTGLVYVVSGIFSLHFRQHLLPTESDPRGDQAYNRVQRSVYLGVIFVLFPLVIWTGLAMSPAVTSVLPIMVNIVGGQQSARTIHFFVAVLLLLFLLVHVTMVLLNGFSSLMKGMITGRTS